MRHSFDILNFDNVVASLLWKHLGNTLPRFIISLFFLFPFRGRAPQRAFSFSTFRVCECTSSTSIGVVYV